MIDVSMAGPDPEQLITIARAREIVAGAVRPLPSEAVPVAEALGRALAEDVRALGDVPAFANSAMDGFAVRAGPAGRRLRIVGESRAGAPWTGTVEADQAVAISTGAMLPAGAEAVVPVETATVQAGWVTLGDDAPAQRNLRAAGEDMRRGQLVLERGSVLGAAGLAVAVAAGHGELHCARRPRLAIVTSGDELRPAGAPLGPGQIHNSNLVAIAALAELAGAAPAAATSEAVGDDLALTRDALAAALSGADVLVVTGGVSVGEHDHVKAALAELGVEQRFWRVALRPGKPTWFGVRDGALVFGLPGNPVSAMVTFLLFVRPALAALQGVAPERSRRAATLGEAVPRHPNRDEAVRVRLEADAAGDRRAVLTGPQGSHQLTSMLGADALLVVERGPGEIPAGTRVEVEPIALGDWPA